MNKIFKVVWNRTIGSFVVTSELAKGRVKSSSEGAEGDVRTSEEGRLKTLFRLTALSAALLGFSEGAWAAMNAKPATGGAVFAIGDGSTSANGTGALAIGNNAQAKTNGALAIGPNSTHTTIANGNNAIAIGVNLQATGQKAIGIGTDTTANGSGAIAIGNNDANRMANQGVNGNGAIGVGSNLTANGNNAIAVGTEAQATAISAVAVGANTQATGAEAVAIGKGAASTASKALAFGQGARAQAGNTVAFGTGAQATQDGSIAIGTNTIATGVYKDTSRKGKAIAIGYNTNALGESSIAIGTDDSFYGALTASSRQGIAIGTGAKATGATQSIALGPDAISSGTQSTSIGNNTRATGDSSIAIGGDDWNIVREKTVAAAGNKQVHQVFQDLTGMPMKQQGEAYGNPFKGTTAGDAAVAIGVAALAEGALSTAFGSGTSASGVGAAAFGVGATASQNKSVAIGAGSHTRTDATAVTEATVNGVTYRGFAGTEHITTGSQVSFGSAGYERQLKHVAPGAITPTSTDAINGSQLYALHVGAGNIAKSVANALGGGAAVSNDPTNNQGSFVTLPTYDVLKGSDTPNTVGNGTAKFNATPAKNVADALTNLNTYVNQGFAVKDNAGAEKGIVTPGESVQFADGNVTTVTVDTEANGNTKIKYDVQVDGETVKIKNGKLTAASQTHFYSVKNEDQTKGNYNNDGATGDNALAAGVDASATANGTTAVGLKAQASAESAIAVGSETKAAAKNAVVIGNKASVEAATGSVANVNGTTTGEGSVAVGAASKASGTNATAVGQAANAFGQNSFAGGQASNALGKSSVALGDGANALNDSAVALGAYTNANNAGATAVGFNTNALGWASFAGGHSAKAEASSAVALGHEAQAAGSKAVAIGKSSHAAKESGIALGDGAKAAEVNAIAIGSTNNAWKEDSIALGRLANADGAASLALGLNSHTRLENAIALGNGANADYSNSIAIGKSSHAAESAGVAIGNDAQALKYSSVVIGDQARSNNSRSVVIGYHASATNPAKPASAETDYNQTVAIGAYANAWGDQSTAIGNNVDAKGNSSIAIGADDWDTVAVKTVDGTGKTVKEVYQDYTGDVMATGKDSYTHTTSGEAAVAIGTKSQAIGELSTAFGTGTIAEGVASAAFGMGAKATKGNSVAIGAGSTTTTNAISVNEATVNNLKYSGFAGGNNVTSGDQVSFGSKNYERQLKNVAPGEISNTSTDAINGSQLYAVQNVLGNTAKTVKNVLGGNAAVGEDGGFTMSNIGGTGKNTIDEAIRDLNANAYKPFKLTTAKTANTNGTVQDDSLQNITSGSTITLEAGKNIALRQNGATVSINTVDNPEFAGKVTAKGGLDMGGNKITNVAKGDTAGDAVNLEQLQDAMANLRVSTLTTVNNDAPFSYVGTDGRILRREVTVAPGTGVKTVSFKHMDDNTEYTGDVTIAALNPTDPQTTTPTTVGNVKDGAKANDAVNVSQLNKIAEAIGTKVNPDGTITAPTYNVISGDPSTSSVAGYNKVGDALTALSSAVRTPLYFEGDSGEKIDRLLGSTVAIKGGQNNADKLSENNIGVVADKNSGTLNVKLAKELTGLTSAAFSGDVTTAGTTVNGSGVTIGSGSNPVSLTAGGLSNGGNKVTNIADGAVDTDAASYKQVKAAKTEVQGGTNVASVTKTDSPTDGHTVYTVNAKGAAVALDSSVDGLKLTSSEDTTTNVTTYKLDLSGKTKASLTKADSALQNIGVQVNGEDAKTLNQADSKLNFVNGTGTTAENKGGAVAFNVNKSTLTAGTDGTVNAGKAGDAFATAADVAQAINEAVANSEKTSVVEKGDNTHVAAVEAGNKTTYTVHADNTTVSVKDGGKLKLESSEKANANQTKTTNYELDLTDAAKAEIQKGVDAKTAVDTKGITFNGDSGSPVTKKLDETLAIKGDDKNVETEAGTNGIKVKLKDDITLTSVTAETLKAGDSILTTTGLTTPKVTAGDSVLTTDGLTIANGANPVSLTKSGLNNGGNKIAKVAKGTDATDGVNVSQLSPIAKALNTSIDPATGDVAAPAFTVTKADGTKHEAVGTVQDALNKVGEEVSKGLKIAADNGNEDKVNLGETVTYTSKDKNIVTTVADNKIDFSLAEKVTIGKDAANGGKPVVIDGKEGIVSGLTNTTLGGTDFATSNKAATEAQLDATQVNLKNILGGEAKNENGNVSTANIGDTGKGNVHEAIKSVKETAEKGWKLKVNEETSSEKISPDDEVAIKEGKNIKVTRNGKNITVATAEDVEFNAVNATNVIAETVIAGNSVLTTDGLKIGADSSPNQVSLTTAGLNNGGNKIANVAKGTEDTDGVNVSQIKPLATALNTTVGADGSIAEPNFTVNHADGTAGTPVHTVQDALNEVGKELNKGLNIVADNGSSEKVNLGDTVTYTSKDKNIVTTSGTGKAIDFSLAEKVTIGKDAANGGKPVVIDGKEGIVSGLTNTTLGSAPLAGSNKAATEAQLDATQVNLATILGGNAANNNGNVTTNNIGGTGKDNVHEAIAAVKETADKGWNLKANDETESEKIAAGDTVTVKQGKNIRVKRSGKDLTVETEDDVAFNKVTVGNSELTTTGLTTPKVTAGDSVLTTDGLTIANGANPVSLTKSGLDNGGNKIANVAKGTKDTDGVNVSQIKPLATALNTTVGADGSIAEPNFTVNHADGTAGTPVHTVQDALNEVGKELNKGLNIVADNGSSEKVNLGDTVKYTSKDKNIVTTSGTGKAIDFSLAEKVTIGKDAANGGKPVVIDGKEGIVSGLTNTTLGSAPLAGSNKAATEAQLDATQVNLATILGGNAANNNGNVTTNNIGGTGKDNVHEAIAAVKETADKGWNLKANDETESEKIAAGDTVTVKQGKNIRVKRSGKELTVETEDDVEFDHVKADSVAATSVVAESVIAGNSVLTTEGLKIGADGSPSQVSLTTAGLNNGGNKIANVAKGVADTDAVNVSQLNPIAKALNTSINPTTGAIEAPVFTVTKADGTKHEAVGTVQDALDKVGEEVSKGLNIVADNGSSEKVNLGDTVKYTSKDKNIVTTSGTGKAIDFSLAEKVTIGKDAANGGKPVVIDGKEGIVSGLTNTTLGAAPLVGSNKAVTEAQLDATQVNLANVLGGNAANNNGNVTTSDIGGTGENNVHDAIKSVKATADKGWKLKANDEADSESEKIAAGDTVTVKQGKNIRVKRSGKDLTIETEDDVAFNKVTVGDSVLTTTGLTTPKVTAGDSVLTTDGLNIANGAAGSPVSLTKDGLNNGGNKVTSVAKGTADTDAVNVSQLNPVAKALNTNIDPITGEVAAPSFTVTKADGTKHPAVGTVQDALNKVGEEVTKGINVGGTTGSNKYALGGTINIKGDNNIVSDTVEGGVQLKLADTVKIGQDSGKPVSIDGTTGTVSGLSNTTLGNTPLAGSNKAATEAQLDATQVNLANVLGGNAANNNGNVTTSDIGGTGEDNIHDAIKSVKATADKGWNLNANDETSSEKIGAGDTVTFKEGKNVKVSRNGKNITVATSDDVSFNKVTVGGSVLTDNGLTVGNGKAGKPVSLTKDGLDNGGNKVANVAKGEADTDAVNVAQLKAAAAKATSKVDSGNDNIVVTPEQNADGSTTYKVATAPNLKADSFTAGDTVVNNDGVKVGDKVALGKDGLKAGDVNITADGIDAGNKAISNVAKGVKATDAVNVAQLNEQLAATEKTTTVAAGKNVTVSEKVDGNNTEYTVNADKTTLSQAANGAVKVSEGAKDADGVTDYALDLTDEAKADIAKGVAAKDAVDNKGLTFAADNGTTGAKKLGDSLSVKGDGNILTRADENGIGFSLADKITVGKAGKGNKPLVIDGTAGLISGLSNTTLGGADFATKGQAASEEQLNATQANLANLLGGNAANDKGNVTTSDIGGTGKDNVHDAIAAVKETADKGWNLNANDETSSEKIGAGDTVTFKEGKNVKVSRNGKNITVATSDDVSFNKVTVGGSVLTDNGLTVGNGKAGKPVSLTKDGLDNGGNKVANVAKGEADTDAVNVAQLKAAAAKATSKVDSGNDNIVVTPEQNADGSTTYKVATAPNLKADSFTAGDTVVNNDGVKVGDKVALGKDGLKAGDVNITADGINAGNKAINNVAAGVKDTDAANVGQLNRLTAAAKTEVEAGTNIASVTGKQGKNGQTVYTVNADGASVSAGSDNIVVTKGNKDADNVTDYAVDLSKAVKADIAKGVAAKDAVDNKGISFAGDSGTTVANKLGDTVAVKGDANITTTAGANGIQVGLNKDLKVDSVKAGDTVVNNSGVNVGDKVVLGKDGLKAGDVNITAEGINAGGKKVTGVAAGTVAAGSTDAVNGGQLHQVYELIGSNGGNVNTAPPSVEADGKAGVGNIKNITLVDNSTNPNVTNITNETKIAQSNGYSLVTYNVEDQGMYVTNNVIEAVGRMNEQGIKFFHTNDGEVNPDVQARNSEDSSASGAYATAVGYQAASKGTNAIAIGKGAKANAENTIAIGTGNIVSGKNSGAIGDPTVVSGNSSYSIGNNNNVSADNAYALGSNIKATVKDSVYLGDRAQTQGIHTADAAKGEAYTYGGLNDKAVAGKAGSAAAANKVAGVVTVGNGTDETRQVQGVAAGVVSADSTDAINGSQLYYTNQAIANVATQATAAKTEVTAGKNVVVNQTTGNSGQTVYNVATTDKLDVTSVTAGGVTVNAQGVSIAAPTAHNPANTVSLSPIGLNNGGQRITNVAPAKEGTDAVNLNQLAGVGNALQNNIERVGKKAYAGVAGAIAQGSIPQVTRPGATGIGVGSGYYGGQSAMAIGVSAMSDGGNWVVKGNFSANTDGHVGVGAGALYQW